MRYPYRNATRKLRAENKHLKARNLELRIELQRERTENIILFDRLSLQPADEAAKDACYMNAIKDVHRLCAKNKRLNSRIENLEKQIATLNTKLERAKA